MDDATLFIGGALRIEVHEAGEDLGIDVAGRGGDGGGEALGRVLGEGDRARGEIMQGAQAAFLEGLPEVAPTVGGKDGGIEIVVELLEEGDEALVVDELLLRREGLSAAKLFEDVVHAGERETGMLGLHALAVRIQLLRQGVDALFVSFGRWLAGKQPMTDVCSLRLVFKIHHRGLGSSSLKFCSKTSQSGESVSAVADTPPVIPTAVRSP